MSLISTIKASCRDCYKCVRNCPVKAIRITDGHAEVVEERCVADGRCVAVCPQNAKKIESGIEITKAYLKSGFTTVASLAPSFVTAFPQNSTKLISGLRKLGFDYVSETAEGAELVAKEHLRAVENSEEALITSCCPAIVNLIEKYYPELLPNLAPIVSPMAAHGQILKERYGEATKVIFIGPCIAKKGELAPDDAEIDAVITFVELKIMLMQAGISLTELPEGSFDGPGAVTAYTFATPGGLALSASLSTDLLAREIVSIDGLDESIMFLDRFAEVKHATRLVELMACPGGCLSGPGMTGELNAFSRRDQLIAYGEAKQNAAARSVATPESPAKKIDLSRVYRAQPVLDEAPSEGQIQEVLAKTGKFTSVDELNCGACGYNSCREKAIAVMRGLAEVDMCIPYMRAKAESRANLICQMTPNAIFVVDSQLQILDVNPSAEARFSCQREKVLGHRLATIIDDRAFEQALTEKNLVAGEVSFPGYGLVAWQAVFYVETEDVVIGIFADMTKEHIQRDQLDRMTEETLEKAQEVINKQMRVAQEIAGLLGETTAETKVLLTKLMNLFKEK